MSSNHCESQNEDVDTQVSWEEKELLLRSSTLPIILKIKKYPKSLYNQELPSS